MKKYLHAALALTLAALLTGCTPVPGASKADRIAASGHGSRWNSWSADEPKYTKADYDLALSFRTEGYEKQSVAEFDRKALDWENEETFHKTEDAFQRLYTSLPEDDPNREFIFRTLFTTWKECEKKHYNACAHNSAPWYGGWAKCETKGDIFGDEAVLSGGYLDFSFNYTIADEAELTVGERDGILRGIETGMEEFLSGRDQKALEQEESMKKTLEAELKRRLKALNSGLVWAGDVEVDYDWERSFESGNALTEGTICEADFQEGWEERTSYTKEQYDLAVGNLKFDGYETMSIAEFDRRVHAALEGDWTGNGEETEKFLTAYEMVLAYLPETDPNYRFFHETIQDSQQEYEARAREVYTGKTTDPEKEGSCSSQVEEDVFGDQVTVGAGEARYRFTYRILQEDMLTVKERDAFLQEVQQGAQEALDKALKENGGQLSAEKFRSALEAAGKAASTEKIRFTGCRVDSCEVYR